VHIEDIDPAESLGVNHFAKEPTLVKGRSTRAFDVAPEYGPATPGQYSATCFVRDPDNWNDAKTEQFSVVAEAAGPRTAQGEVTPSSEGAKPSTEAQKPAEVPVVTPAPNADIIGPWKGTFTHTVYTNTPVDFKGTNPVGHAYPFGIDISTDAQGNLSAVAVLDYNDSGFRWKHPAP
jgi:hypothetical protein